MIGHRYYYGEYRMELMAPPNRFEEEKREKEIASMRKHRETCAKKHKLRHNKNKRK